LAPINFAVYAIETRRELLFSPASCCTWPAPVQALGAGASSSGAGQLANLHMSKHAVSIATPPTVANIEPKREGA
jgi:hypothetical protein